MSSKKYKSKIKADSSDQLESQFILRLPVEPAKLLREAMRKESSLEDMVAIDLNNDLRHGNVRVDHWQMSARLVNLPTIIESHKSIDGKRLYKTADICQMLTCREFNEQTTTDEDSLQEKEEDSNNVDYKYLWPHGITPPTKNIRKRRFRKTLKKDSVETPDIMKEVKKLLKLDYESVSVKWEVIHEQVKSKESVELPKHVDEHDIFGEALSDSDNEDIRKNTMDVSDKNYQISKDDNLFADRNYGLNISDESTLHAEFTNDMFRDVQHSPSRIQDMDYHKQSSGMSCSE